MSKTNIDRAAAFLLIASIAGLFAAATWHIGPDADAAHDAYCSTCKALGRLAGLMIVALCVIAAPGAAVGTPPFIVRSPYGQSLSIRLLRSPPRF